MSSTAVVVCSFEQSNPPSHPQEIVHGSMEREHEHRAELSQPHLINWKMLSGAVGVLAGSVKFLLMASLFYPSWLGQLRLCLISIFPDLGAETTLLLRKQYWLLPFSLSTSWTEHPTFFYFFVSIASSYGCSRLLDNISLMLHCYSHVLTTDDLPLSTFTALVFFQFPTNEPQCRTPTKHELLVVKQLPAKHRLPPRNSFLDSTKALNTPKQDARTTLCIEEWNALGERSTEWLDRGIIPSEHLARSTEEPLIHMEEFESAESAERAMSGHGENVEALPYRCM